MILIGESRVGPQMIKHSHDPVSDQYINLTEHLQNNFKGKDLMNYQRMHLVSTQRINHSFITSETECHLETKTNTHLSFQRLS